MNTENVNKSYPQSVKRSSKDLLKQHTLKTTFFTGREAHAFQYYVQESNAVLPFYPKDRTTSD